MLTGRRAPAASTTSEPNGSTPSDIAGLRAAIAAEMAAALAEPDCPAADRAFWSIVAAGLNGALSWTQVQRAHSAIETAVVGRCPFGCGGGLIERADCPPPAYTCFGCGRLWPYSLDYKMPAWRLREILGEPGPEVA